MKETHCPVCHDPLEVRDVAPCDECGGDPDELAELEEGAHKYNEYALFGDLRLILCDFCDADFSSYDPTYFGLAKGTKVGLTKMQFIKEIDNPKISKDKFCSNCGHRLSFLRFVIKAREQNAC